MSVNLFDANYYREVNFDLANFSDPEAWAHFQQYGIDEGRRFSRLVDLNFYRDSNPDLAGAGVTSNRQLYEHLQTYGVGEGRQFSPGVNLKLYLAFNQDLSEAYGSDLEAAFEHLQIFGVDEDRQPGITFDPNFYRGKYSDLQQAGLSNVSLLDHFLKFGINEGRQGSEVFDVSAYLEQNRDLVEVGLNNQEALRHFAYFGIREGRSSIDIDPSSSQVVGAKFSHLFPQVLVKQESPYDTKTYMKTAVDSVSNLYAIGHFGEIYGSPNVFLSKYDAFGTELWAQRLVGIVDPLRFDLEVDSAGNTYITGSTKTSLGGDGAEGEDAFVAKYDTSGNRLWIQQLGEADRNRGSGVALDSFGNIYITGELLDDLGVTTDAFVAKYDSNGTLLWLQKLESVGESVSNDVAVDSAGDVYITGHKKNHPNFITEFLTGRPIDASDPSAFVAKYSSSGTFLWERQLASNGIDESNAVGTDSSGNVYIAGRTKGWNRIVGDLCIYCSNSGTAFVAKYDKSGTQLWVRETSEGQVTLIDFVREIDIDGADNIYLVEGDFGSVRPMMPLGLYVLSKYDSTGTQLWRQQQALGGLSATLPVDSSGDIYLASQHELTKFVPTETIL